MNGEAAHDADDVTQHNAADADQGSQIATDMEQQSHRLNEYVRNLVALIKGTGKVG